MCHSKVRVYLKCNGISRNVSRILTRETIKYFESAGVGRQTVLKCTYVSSDMEQSPSPEIKVTNSSHSNGTRKSVTVFAAGHRLPVPEPDKSHLFSNFL